jgi:hypothetical protein
MWWTAPASGRADDRSDGGARLHLALDLRVTPDFWTPADLSAFDVF